MGKKVGAVEDYLRRIEQIIQEAQDSLTQHWEQLKPHIQTSKEGFRRLVEEYVPEKEKQEILIRLIEELIDGHQKGYELLIRWYINRQGTLLKSLGL